MDDIARLPSEERRVYFEQAAARWGRLIPQLMEKDFWVCWLLNRVFRLDELGEHLTFKGGTSLSKVYNAIERFSEDIDLSIERSYLGFGGDDEPEKGRSGKETQRRIKRLNEACQQAVSQRFVPQLRSAITLNLDADQDWELTLDGDDPDSQSIQFRYPAAVIGGVRPYFASRVTLELGARSDHFPVEAGHVHAYLYDALAGVLSQTDVSVRVLTGERTFWEKATILHANAHLPNHKRLPLRLSRHYYDLYQLANHRIGERALKAIHLLERVAVHKTVFFKAAWARYDLARPGTLKFIPDEVRLGELRRDYADMEPMFFGDVPDFDEIIDCLRQTEGTINET